jgi:AcrR family transcriptional regulator
VNASSRTPGAGSPDGTDHAAERLSPERVLAAALDIVDTHGLNALTMRRLGQKLKRNPMSLYRYFPNRAALLDSLVEHLLNQLPAPTQVDSQDWQAQLRAGGHQFRNLAVAHPNAVPLLVTQPLITPLGQRPTGTLRLLEQLLTLLTNAGLNLDRALHIARTYTGCLLGHVLTELQQLNVDPDEPDPLYRLGLHRLPRQQFPQLRSAAPQLAHYDGRTELDFTLDVLFNGLTSQLTQPRSRH